MSRPRGSKNLKPSKADLYKSLEVSNLNTESFESKAVPPSFGRIDALIISPKVLSNNPIELLKLNKGYTGVCNTKNATAIASIPLRLFAVSDSKNEKFVFPFKQLNKVEIERIKSESKTLSVKRAHNIVEIVEHPVFDVLNNVNNGDLNYFDLMEMTAAYLGMIGNAYWEIEKEKGIPSGINVLPAEYTCVTLSDDMKVKGYRLFNGIYEREFQRDQVIHFKNVSPGLFWRTWNSALITGLYGIGDAEYVLDEIYLYNSIMDYLRALTENNAIPSGIIKYTGGRLDKNTMQDVQSQWDKVLRSWKRAGKVKVMDTDFDFQALSMPPKEMDFTEGRSWLRGVIANAFGVPEDLITSSNSNRATSNTAVTAYFRFSIKPRLKRLEERLNSHLMPLYDDNLFLAFDECVPIDDQLLQKREQGDLAAGVITINEVRISRGLQPVSWGEVPYIPVKENIRADANPAGTDPSALREEQRLDNRTADERIDETSPNEDVKPVKE